MLGLCALSLILTSSRAAWSIALLGSLVFTIYQGWYWIVGIVTALATIILSAAYAPPPLKEPLRALVPRYFWARITDEMYPNRPTEITRLSQWNFAWDMTRSHPISGWGLQSFGPLYQASTHVWLGYPHNLLLMLSSNLGIPATIAIFWAGRLDCDARDTAVSQFSAPMARGTHDLFYLHSCLCGVYHI